MMETALAFEGGRLPKGPRIGFVTTSGGTVDLLYDYAEEIEGSSMPDFAAETQGGDDAVHAGRHRAEEPARSRHSPAAEAAAGVCEVVANDPNIDMIAWAADAAEQGRRLGRRRALQAW